MPDHESGPVTGKGDASQNLSMQKIKSRGTMLKEILNKFRTDTNDADFDKLLRVKQNHKHKPHLIEPFQDTESSAITFAIRRLSRQNLTIDVTTQLQKDQIQFTVPRKFKIEGNCLAAALACLCGKNYQSIHFEFLVSAEAQALIAKGCQATVTASEVCPPRLAGNGHCLGFSGGMDSLASKHIAPDRNYDLIGIDFGGWFEREYLFLKEYDQITSVCSTNFRRKKYDRNSWMFMAAPMLLVADHFGWGSVAFGTTLESNPETLYGLDWTPPDLPILEAGGLKNETLLFGCSEFLGSRIVLVNEKEAVENSLVSLAAIGSEKSFRKALALHLVNSLMKNQPTDRFDIAPPREKVVLGKESYVDFAFMVFAKFCDPEWLSLAVDIPDDILASVRQTKLDWLLKYHPIGLEKVTGQARKDLEAGLKKNQIEVFSDNDLRDYEAFTDLVRNLQLSG